MSTFTRPFFSCFIEATIFSLKNHGSVPKTNTFCLMSSFLCFVGVHTKQGGAFVFQTSRVKFHQVMIGRNRAEQYAGGISFDTSQIQLTDVTMEQNQANYTGGIRFLHSNGTILRGSFISNRAKEQVSKVVAKAKKNAYTVFFPLSITIPCTK
jgi:hypothetical protein